MIVTIAIDAKNRGFARIGILGQSDIDFIIEYAARNAGLEYAIYDDDREIPADSFVFVSENWPAAYDVTGKSVAHIYELLAGEN